MPDEQMMTTPLERRRQFLREQYHFDFPDDFFRFWEMACRLRPLEPLNALAEALGVVLVGPFEVLAGRFDGRSPRYSLLLHWRYHDDPPELFTVLAGAEGQHWGYYLDDPSGARVHGGGCVASYDVHDAYELSTNGDDLFQAARLEMEYRQSRWEDALYEEDGDVAQAEAGLRALDELRRELLRCGTADRPESGGEYTDRYDGVSARAERVVAATLEGMGVVVPTERYAPLSVKDKKLWARLRKEKDPADLVEEARRALREGFPGTALKLGKDLWATRGRKKAQYACELLDEAYEALGREALRRVLHTHRANRDLPTVDILEAEAH
jgi:hypothetical protein